MDTLETLLEGKAEAPTPAPVATTDTPAPAPTPTDQPRDEKGKFAPVPKAEEVPAPAAAVPTPEEIIDRKKYDAAVAQANAERKKRQEYERKLAEVSQPRQPVPDFAQDPNGYRHHLENTVQRQLIDQKVNMSVMMAKSVHSDYDKVMEAWADAIQANPALLQQAEQEMHPGEWAYQQMKRQSFLAEVGDDPSSYRQKIEAEIRAKLEAEYAQRAPAVAPPPAAPAPSLASVTGRGRMNDAANQPQDSLESMFNRRSK